MAYNRSMEIDDLLYELLTSGQSNLELAQMLTRMKEDRYFWSRVDIQGYDNCWSWIGPISAKGYGRASVRAGSWDAHRWAFYVSRCHPDEIPKVAHDHIHGGERKVVHHRCGNPVCCNPLHLQLVLHGKNISLGWPQNSGDELNRPTDFPQSTNKVAVEKRTFDRRQRYLRGID